MTQIILKRLLVIFYLVLTSIFIFMNPTSIAGSIVFVALCLLLGFLEWNAGKVMGKEEELSNGLYELKGQVAGILKDQHNQANLIAELNDRASRLDDKMSQLNSLVKMSQGFRDE